MNAQNLKTILDGVVRLDPSPIPDIVVTGISTDSREVTQGNVFIAIKGLHDGHNYIDMAIRNGAIAVIGERRLNVSVPYFVVSNSRFVWAQVLSNWYAHPEQKLKLIGVSGTDGKTTTVSLIHLLLKNYGLKSAMTSTIEAIIGNMSYDTGLHSTTPNIDLLWNMIDRMAKAGEEYAVIEVTSHSLDQHRFGNIIFEIGLLTRVTHDHLLYHKTIDKYREAKARLLKSSKLQILNFNDQAYDYFASVCSGNHLFYNLKTDVKDAKYEYRDGRLLRFLKIKYQSKWIDLETALLGDYNIENILAACKVAEIMSIPDILIQSCIKKYKGPTGRLEWIENSRELNVIIDYAHTEYGMYSVLNFIKPFVRENNSLIVVFGCSSARDDEKRPKMGEVAMTFADKIIITNEDPRLESPEQIFMQIEAGCKKKGGVLNENYWRIDDRKNAIDFAINNLSKYGDWIIFLGKGHEKSICIGEIEYPWNEFEAVQEALSQH